MSGPKIKKQCLTIFASHRICHQVIELYQSQVIDVSWNMQLLLPLLWNFSLCLLAYFCLWKMLISGSIQRHSRKSGIDFYCYPNGLAVKNKDPYGFASEPAYDYPLFLNTVKYMSVKWSFYYVGCHIDWEDSCWSQSWLLPNDFAVLPLAVTCISGDRTHPRLTSLTQGICQQRGLLFILELTWGFFVF